MIRIDELQPTHLKCPNCGVTDSIDGEEAKIWRMHHEANWLAPECSYWLCDLCGYQWGHE